MITTKIFGVVTAVLLAASCGLFYLWDSEKTERIRFEQAYDQLEVTHKEMKADFEEQVERNTELNRTLVRVEIERDQVNNQLNGYRDREKLLKRKPKTIERLANAATQRLFIDFHTLTTGESEDTATEASPDTTDRN